MAFTYFFIGFVSALLFSMAFLCIIYMFLKRKRSEPYNIKGYLDIMHDLTPEQKKQVQEIRQVFLPKVEKIRQNLYMKRAELADLFFTAPIDRAKIDTTAKQILEHQWKLENEVIDHILEEKELLNSSQQEKFYEIIVDQFASGGLGVHDVKGRKG